MFMNEVDEEAEEGMPILVMHDRASKTIFADVVPATGLNPYAVARMKANLESLGYKRVVIKTDQEPAIMALKEAVVRETHMEVVKEESPIGESSSNGEIENAVKRVQAQVRTLKSHLQTESRGFLDRQHHITPWMIRHAANCISRHAVGEDGKTARQRLRGRKFNTELVQFGECVWYLKLKSKGHHKWEERWEDGVWLGVSDESGEAIIGTDVGVVKARTVRRKGSQEERWDAQQHENMRGVPWATIPGTTQRRIQTDVNTPDMPLPNITERKHPETEQVVRRRIRITKDDLENWGLPPGCQ